MAKKKYKPKSKSNLEKYKYYILGGAGILVLVAVLLLVFWAPSTEGTTAQLIAPGTSRSGVKVGVSIKPSATPTTTISPNGNTDPATSDISFTLVCKTSKSLPCKELKSSVIDATASCPAYDALSTTVYTSGTMGGTVMCGQNQICQKVVCYAGKDNEGNTEAVKKSNTFYINKVLPICRGGTATTLALSPASVTSGGTVAAMISGLSGCVSKEILIQKGWCGPAFPVVARCSVGNTGDGCSAQFTASAVSATTSEKYYACTHINADADYFDAGEAVFADLTITPAPPTYRLYINKTGAGYVAYGGEICETAQSICSKDYTQVTNEILLAYPMPGSVFMGWQGCTITAVIPDGRSCQIRMDGNKVVSASFALTGTIEVITYAANWMIYLDDEYKGTTQAVSGKVYNRLTLANVRPGTHSIGIKGEADTRYRYSMNIDAVSGQTVEAEAILHV